MAFILRNATVHDAEGLAHMNKRLVEDEALLLLRQQRFGRDATVEIDVLDLNSRGEHFWTAMGFKPYCINMKLPPE